MPCRAVPAYRRLHNPRSGDNAGRSARHHGGPGRRSAAAPHRAPRRRRLPPPQRLRAGRDPRPPPRPLPSGEVAPTHPVPSRLGGREGWSSYPLLSSDPPGHPASPLVSGGARSRLLSRPLPAETPAAAPPSRQLFLPPRRSRLLLRLPASRPLGRRVRVRHPASGAASAQLGSAHAQWNGAGADRISPRVPGARKREAGERERAAPGGDRKGRAVTGPGAMSQSAVPRAVRMRSRRGAARTLRVGGGSWSRVVRLALPASRLRARGGRAAGPERFRALRRAEIGLRLPGGPPWLGGRGQCQAEGLQHPFFTPSLSTVLSTSPACEGRGYPVCRSSAAVPQVNVRERLSEPYRKPALGLFQTTGFSC